MRKPRHIAIITTTRADWGIMYPVADLLRKDKRVRLSILCGNMHLDPNRGMTITEIEHDGFDTIKLANTYPANDTPGSIARAMSVMVDETARKLENLSPDMVLILGDRYEILAAATATAIMNIPIAHIAGGELTEGALDDNFRHAISKLSSLHFVTTESHRQRLIAMGEQPQNVINAGALGIDNVINSPVMSRDQLEQSLGFTLGKRPVLVTFHPATTDKVNPTVRFSELLTALDRLPDLSPLFTYPNNDAGGDQLIEMIERYVATRPDAHAVASLGRVRYMSMLAIAEAVIGNSSSGLVEVPSAGIATVNIGCRQHRRTSGPSVINTGDTADEITAGIIRAVSSEFRDIAAAKVNPYYQPETATTIAWKLAEVDIASLLPKNFYDIR